MCVVMYVRSTANVLISEDSQCHRYVIVQPFSSSPPAILHPLSFLASLLSPRHFRPECVNEFRQVL